MLRGQPPTPSHGRAFDDRPEQEAQADDRETCSHGIRAAATGLFESGTKKSAPRKPTTTTAR